MIGSGVLRGYKDTRAIFFITFIAYWVLGLPSGYLLALTDVVVPAMGPSGFWIGFIIGLTFAAIMMALRITLAAETADRRHPAAIHALSPRPAGFIPGRAAVLKKRRTAHNLSNRVKYRIKLRFPLASTRELVNIRPRCQPWQTGKMRP